MAGISYLFPPDQILKLPTWRFVLHFTTTPQFHTRSLQQAVTRLKAAQWKIITFSCSLDSLTLDDANEVVSVPYEVTEDRRKRPESLGDYESDVWKIMGNMMSEGFGDVYYEALDWQE